MIVENQPMQEYLDNEGIGSSQLKNMLTMSPMDYLYSLKEKSKDTRSTMLGTYIHTYMLERHLMESEYMIQPEDWGSLAKNPGRAKWTEFKKQAEEQGKKAIKYADGEFALKLDEQMQEHGELKNILSKAKAEVSFYAEIDGIKLKSREDLYCEADGSVWDVKSISKDIDDESLAKAIFDNGYHFAAAHHINVMRAAGATVNSWGWIFVATKTPVPHIIIKKASNDLLDAGMNDWNHAFNLLKECTKTNCWPGYSDEIEEIGLPEWVERKYY